MHMGKNEIAPVKNEIVVYQPNETLRLEVSVQNETVWLTQAQIAELLGCELRLFHVNSLQSHPTDRG